MKKVNQLRTDLEDLSEEVGNTDVTKLTSLVRSGLFDSNKLMLLKRALNKDNAKMTKVERNTLLELLDKLLVLVTTKPEVYTKVKSNVHEETDFLDIELNEESPKMAIDINQIPSLLILKRRAIRVFPDGQKVALYWADRINKFVSVPFESIGISEEMINEISQDLAVKTYLARRYKEGSTDDSLESAKNRIKAGIALNRISRKHGPMARDIAKDAGLDAVKNGEAAQDLADRNKLFGSKGYGAAALKMPLAAAIGTIAGGLIGTGLKKAIGGSAKFVRKNTVVRLPEEHMDTTENFKSKLQALREQSRVAAIGDNIRGGPISTTKPLDVARSSGRTALRVGGAIAGAVGGAALVPAATLAATTAGLLSVLTPSPLNTGEDEEMAARNAEWARTNDVTAGPTNLAATAAAQRAALTPATGTIPPPGETSVFRTNRQSTVADLRRNNQANMDIHGVSPVRIAPPANPLAGAPPGQGALVPPMPAPSLRPAPTAVGQDATGAAVGATPVAPATVPAAATGTVTSATTATGTATAARTERANRNGRNNTKRRSTRRIPNVGNSTPSKTETDIKYPVKVALSADPSQGINPFNSYRNYMMSKSSYPGQVADVNEDTVGSDNATTKFVDPSIIHKVKRRVALPKNQQLASLNTKPRLAQNVRQATVSFVRQVLNPPQETQQESVVKQLRVLAESDKPITQTIFDMKITSKIAEQVMNTYNELNEENRVLFEHTINKDKDGFKQIINFALGN